MNVMTAQTIMSEVGLDMTRWPSESHFASWLGLCPNNVDQRGKVPAKRHPADRVEPRRYRLPDPRLYTAAQRPLPRGTIPEIPE